MTRRYVEYDKNTGKILSVLNATAERALSYVNETTGVLEVPEGFICDVSVFVVKNGEIVRSYETTEERRERERVEEERKQMGIRELAALGRQLVLAMLFNDNAEVQRVRQEAQPLKKYYR
jgi:hypothetical protein